MTWPAPSCCASSAGTNSSYRAASARRLLRLAALVEWLEEEAKRPRIIAPIVSDAIRFLVLPLVRGHKHISRILVDFGAVAALDRLVGDFERWMVQTDKVTYQTDGVMLLNSKNLGKAVADTPLIFTAFYAPWCHFSQAMLPKVSGASALLAELVEKNHIPAAAMAIAPSAASTSTFFDHPAERGFLRLEEYSKQHKTNRNPK